MPHEAVAARRWPTAASETTTVPPSGTTARSRGSRAKNARTRAPDWDRESRVRAGRCQRNRRNAAKRHPFFAARAATLLFVIRSRISLSPRDELAAGPGSSRRGGRRASPCAFVRLLVVTTASAPRARTIQPGSGTGTRGTPHRPASAPSRAPASVAIARSVASGTRTPVGL